MRQVEVDFTQRLQLINLLGGQEGRVADIRLLSKIIDKLDFTPEERDLSALTTDPRGIMTWRLPADQPAFGVKVVDLEDAEAERVKTVLEAWPRFRPSDQKWLDPIFESL